MLKLKIQYPAPSQTIVSPEWPEGGPVNSSVAGAYDGTPVEQEWQRDIWGFLERLREVSGIIPSGSPDNALISQRYDALKKISRQIWPIWEGDSTETDTYPKGAIVIASDDKTYQSLIAANYGNDPISSPSAWKEFRAVDIIDDLLSTDPDSALSANQGRILKEALDLIPIYGPATETAQGVTFLRKRIIGSNSTADLEHDISTTAGDFKFASGNGSAWAPSFRKSIDAAWAQGSLLGGLAAGVALTPDTTYHYFALSNPAGSVVDFGFDTNLFAANLRLDPNVIAALGSNAEYSRQLSVVTDASSNIRGFYQTEKKFYWKEQALDVFTFGDGTIATLSPLTVPSLIEVNADIIAQVGDGLNPPSVDYWLLITSPDDVDTLPSQNFSTLGFQSNTGDDWSIAMSVKTDAVTQIRWRHTATALRPQANFGHGFRVWTRGWEDFLLED